MTGKYDAVWVSHSSMGDFLKCPRAYYLHNVYKNPDTGRKITIVSPALSLGSAVHKTLEALKLWPVKEKKTKAAPAAVEQKTNAAANATPPARLASSDLGSTPSRDEEAKRAKRRKPRVLIVMPASDQTIVKSARNIPGVSVVSADSLNVLAVLNHQYLLMPIQSLEKIEQTFLAT